MIRLDDVSYAYPDAPRPALERVNLEVDLIARYVARMLEAPPPARAA